MGKRLRLVWIILFSKAHVLIVYSPAEGSDESAKNVLILSVHLIIDEFLQNYNIAMRCS